jgi:hypothetical protein
MASPKKLQDDWLEKLAKMGGGTFVIPPSPSGLAVGSPDTNLADAGEPSTSRPPPPGFGDPDVLSADGAGSTVKLGGPGEALKTGSVSFTATDSSNGEPVETATVTVAGQSLKGSSVGSFMKVPEGKQPYTASAPVYKPVTGTVLVTAGEDTTIQISLTPKVVMSQPRPVSDDHPPRRPGKGQLSLDEGATFVDRPLGPAVVGPAADTLYTLLDEHGKGPVSASFSPVGAKLNSDGIDLLAEWRQFTKLHVEWNNKYSVVKTNATKGAAELKKIGAAKTIIASGTRGPRGKYLRDAIEDYGAAVDEAESKFRIVTAKTNVVPVALKEIDNERKEQQKLEKGRDVKEKEGEIQTEKERIEDRRNRIRSYFSMAASIINPTEWRKVIVASATCVGEAVFEEVAGSLSSNLQNLQKELDVAQNELASIEDDLALAKIETAAMKWENAKTEAENARQDFFAAAKRVKLKETTVVEAIKSSRATAAAAASIAKRGEIIDSASEASDLITRYLNETKPFLSRIENLGNRYMGYADIAVKSHGNVPYLASLAETAKRNEATLKEFKEYIQVVRALANEAGAYLSNNKAEWMAGYDKIPDLLRAEAADRNK